MLTPAAGRGLAPTPTSGGPNAWRQLLADKKLKGAQAGAAAGGMAAVVDAAVAAAAAGVRGAEMAERRSENGSSLLTLPPL